jgi:hypothetical protein
MMTVNISNSLHVGASKQLDAAGKIMEVLFALRSGMERMSLLLRRSLILFLFVLFAGILEGEATPQDNHTQPDTSTPIVAISLPTSSNTFETSLSAINIAGTATDDVGVTAVTWRNDREGSGAATGATNWTVEGIALQSGTNVITITARDAAGNTGAATLSVNYTPPDTTAPTPVITSPANLIFETTLSTIVVSGMATDDVGVAEVRWSNNREGSGIAVGTTSWAIDGIALQSGTNVITVTARDAAGNTGTAALTINYTPPDTTAPTVTITTPTSGLVFKTSLSTIAIGGTAADDIGVTEVR